MATDDLIPGLIAELRSRGLSISPAEQIDASRAALAVGLESRSRFRAALGSALVKSAEGRALFGEVFDSYFAPPRGSGRRGRRRREAAGGTGSSTGRRPGEPGGGPGGRKPPLRRERAEARRSRPADGRLPHEARGRLRRVVAERPRTAMARRSSAEERGPSHGGDPRRRDLVPFCDEPEEAELAWAVASLVREIRLRCGRRFGRGRRGRLWIKKVVRESLAHGGVPFVLPMRERRPHRPRVLVLVDVSRSVLRAAGLFLLICRGLEERIGRVGFHFFVDRIVDATDVVRGWAGARPGPPAPRAHARRRGPGHGIRPRGGALSFADLVESLPGVDPAAPSDYGRVFHQARSRLPRAAGRDAVLVVLGDARTNRREPLAWAFEEIAARCRRVIWLNPERRALWDTGDSVMSAYMPACDVVCEVRDLDGLATGVKEILRGL